MNRAYLNVRSDTRRLRDLEQKYRRLAALRARRDEIAAAGGVWDPAEGAVRRAAFRQLAAEFPGALRELELPAARHVELADEVAAEAESPELTRPWVHLAATFHALLADALAAKLWLARRVGPRGVVDDATLAELAGPLAREEAEALHHPPGGRVVELVWRELARRTGLSTEHVRALVLEHGGERRLLAALAPRVSFGVPAHGVRGGEIVAEDLARILAELHGAFTRDELDGLGLVVGPEAYPLPEPRLRAVVASLPEEIHGRVHAALDRYAALREDPADVVLVHGDVAAHNLAFDPATGRIVGLFDFAGAAPRDRHHDLKYLPSYGPRVMAAVVAEYERLAGVPISVARVRLLHFATALSYWAWREADPASHDRLSGRTREVALAWVGHALFHL